MKINWTVRVKNKAFWVALVPAIMLFIKALANLVGVELEVSSLEHDLLEFVSAVFALLAVMGVVNDPTTAGLKDSDRAMTYTVPKED